MDGTLKQNVPTGPLPWLERFERLAAKSPGPIPWSVRIQGTPDPDAGHLVIGSCVHGVETGSLPALVHLLEQFDEGAIHLVGSFTVFVGNPDAVRREVRFVEADLNRVFGDAPPPSLEASRAAEIKILLDSATLFVDFHQTMQPSATPFFIFGFHEESYLWARLMGGSSVLVTRDGRQAFSKGSLCGDEYCRARGIPAVTLELGERGLRPEAERLSYATVRALLDWNAVVAHGRKRGSPTLAELAERRPDFTFFQTVHREPFTDPAATLFPSLHNFSRVTVGQVLGSLHGTDLKAPADGVLLFPKYPKRNAAGLCTDPVTGELFHLAVPLDRHPRSLWS